MDFIKIAGQRRPVKFGMLANFKIEEIAGKSVNEFLDEYQQTLSIRGLMTMLYAGFYAGAYLEKQEFDFEVQDMAAWIDQSEDGIILKLVDLFVESQPVDTDSDGEKGN